jgi:hypothetical protein
MRRGGGKQLARGLGRRFDWTICTWEPCAKGLNKTSTLIITLSDLASSPQRSLAANSGVDIKKPTPCEVEVLRARLLLSLLVFRILFEYGRSLRPFNPTLILSS